MVMRFLLDMNVVSELTKPMPNEAVLRALTMHEAACAICAPTLEELVFGCARLQPGARQAWFRQRIDGLLTRVSLLPYDTKAARSLGEERARLARFGTPASRTDGEIAAVAVTHRLKLVTRNRRDFACFNGLELEDWHVDGEPGR